jgi:hypothetical protein
MRSSPPLACSASSGDDCAEVVVVDLSACEVREHGRCAEHGRRVRKVRSGRLGLDAEGWPEARADGKEEDVEEGQGQPTQVVPSQGQEEDEVAQP